MLKCNETADRITNVSVESDGRSGEQDTREPLSSQS